jgi:Putative prokaryotic signal transducing protein
MPLHKDEPLITIATFETELEASFARGALEAIGIPAFVPGEWSGSFSGMYRGLPHRAELKVFESDRDRAVVELRRLQIRIVPPLHDA